MEFIGFVNGMILSPVMFGVLFLSGAVLLFRLKLFPLRSPVKMFKGLFGINAFSSFKAMTVALAGTLGVGNIVGVATAIDMGGAGALFWMLVSTLVAMVIKYAEIVLAILYRRRGEDGWHGGTAYYIKDGMGLPTLAGVFSLLCIMASFTVGNIVQVNAASEAVKGVFEVRGIIVGISIAVIAFFVIYKGIKGISAFTVKLIPIMSVGYIILSLVIIFANHRQIPGIVKDVIDDAFTPSAAGGGIIGFITMESIRYGVVRGIGSNEAGCGTAPTAHATADTDSAVNQGFWGVFEVFVDTVLLCSLTAFVILIYPENMQKYDGMVLAIKAYESFFGNWAGCLLTAAILCFALSTVICWSYYAMESIAFFTRKEIYRKAYIIIYCFAAVAGSLLSLELVWELSDVTISLMAIINCACVICLSGQVKKVTERYLADRK